MNEEPTAMAKALLAAQARHGERLTLRDPAPPEPATQKAAELPKAPMPRVETPAPEPEPARRSAAPPRKPDGGRTPEFVAEFQRLSRLVPAGAWQATLPLGYVPPDQVKPMAIGIAERVKALLPESEHAALHVALGRYTRSSFYLAALAADEAVRWSDDGEKALEPVSEEHRASATAALMLRARARPKGAG
jgi:hypothetical protein